MTGAAATAARAGSYLAACGAVALALSAGPAGAQPAPSVQVNGPVRNPIIDAVATFTVSALDFGPADLPLRLQLQVSTTPDFSENLFADTTVDGPFAEITIPRLLPGSGQLFWRAFALTARAGSVPSPVVGPRNAPTHLRLTSPNNPAGQSLDTARPTFTWQSSAVPASFGRWEYELRIESTATGQPVLVASTSDSSLTVSEDLESNSSFRWRVIARLPPTGETVTAASAASFVIRSSDSPVASLLYRPFPNPFPNAGTSRACIWFDLRTGGNLTLDILDLNGHLVKRIVPRPGVAGPFPPGRYGRPAPGSGGCDERFTWDGTDARGRTVNAGLYLIRLTAEGKAFRERTQFNGR